MSDDCLGCAGTGKVFQEPEKCPYCDGTGNRLPPPPEKSGVTVERVYGRRDKSGKKTN